MSPVRAAVVGAGLMGRWHADALTRVGGRLVAVVDPVEERAAALASNYSATTAATLDELLKHMAVDVVHVTAPLASHAALVLSALAAGCHVLVEKPLAESLATTCRLLDAAQRADRLLCPVHQFLFQDGFLQAVQAVQRIGPLLHVDAVACSAGAVNHDPDALLPEILPHPLALVGRLCPGKLADAAWHIQHPRPGELRATTVLGQVSIGLLLSSAGRPTTNTLRLVAEHGTLHVDLFHGFCVVEPGEVSRARKIVHPFTLAGATLGAAGFNLLRRAARHEPAYPGLRTLIERFYAAVRGEADPPISPTESIAVASARATLVRAMIA
ncbi:MAG TPA: Gfo/Idh/MocA family oxidoreductase [Chloroflexota bacterium]|nr:Gfo/Idh/MocA family oxidoreductase [Chloroflexota bacterium]